MNYLIRYQPIINQYVTQRVTVFDESGTAQTADICELDGWVYASADDSVDLHSVDALFNAELVELTPELRAHIKSISPACALIKRRAHQQIEDAYPIEDQRMLERMAIAGASGLLQLSEGQQAAIIQFNSVNAAALTWAAEQYAALGL